MDITIVNLIYGMCVALLILTIMVALSFDYENVNKSINKRNARVMIFPPSNNYSMQFDSVVVPYESSLINEALEKGIIDNKNQMKQKNQLAAFNKLQASKFNRYNMIDINKFNGYLVDNKGNYYSDNNISIFPLDMALKLPENVSAHYVQPELLRIQPYA
jgi:hypothetical protein